MKTKQLDVHFDVKLLDDDDNFHVFEGYASTFGNVDRGNDRVMRGAFADSIKELRKRAVKVPNTSYVKLMPILWQHQHDNPVGAFVEMREDDKGLFVKGILPKDDDLVKGRVMPQMRSASISDMSIGYSVVEYTRDGDVYNLDKLNLWETSLVTIPMNAEANLTGFKGSVSEKLLPVADRGYCFELKEATERVNGADNAHLFYSEDGEGKVLIADMVDGELKAVPEAIFKAAASLLSEKYFTAKGDARAELLEKYYEKMGLESPFGKSYLLGENEANTLTTRELEKFLFVNGVFSKEAAKLIASKFKPVERDADGASERDAAQKAMEDAVSDKLNQILSLFEKE